MKKKDICHILGSYTPQRNYPAMPVQIRRKKLRDFCKLLASEKGEIYAAMVAECVGYASRNEWTDALKNQPDSYYSHRLKDGNFYL